MLHKKHPKLISLMLICFLALPLLIRTTHTSYAQVDCTVDYVITNQWNSGFQADITITNNSNTPIQGWVLDWTFIGNEQFDSGWNASFTSTGNTVTASNSANHWNGTINANHGAVSFGVQGTHSGNVQIPTNFMINGVACNGEPPLPTATQAPTTNPPTNTPPPATATNVPPSPTPVSTQPPATSTAIPTSNCSVDYLIVNEWNSGFTGEITITNHTNSPVQGWALDWVYANGQQITSAWNVTYQQTGANITMSNPASYWNGNIPANGGTVSFGFQANTNGNNLMPTTFMLNGATCGDTTPPVTPTVTPSPQPTTTPPPSSFPHLGRSINLGNKLEAPIEGTWGPSLEAWNFSTIAQAGFDSVRLPIRWTTDRAQTTAPYTIDADFLINRVQWAVDQALANDLTIVINMHHYEEIYANPYAEKERFLAIWAQVATHFKDYPNDTVVFEILNEPHGNLTATIWNEFLADAHAIIRQSNPHRTIMIGSAEWGGLAAMNQLILPDDNNLIFTVHYYEPFLFTHQGAEWVEPTPPPCNVRWLGTAQETAFIRQRLDEVATWAQQHNDIHVYVGEFGVYKSCSDPEDQARWVNFIARESEARGFSWAYWEFNAGFGAHGATQADGWNYLLPALIP